MAAFKKVHPRAQPRICHCFKIFRIKGLWPWPLTSQGHPKWSPWALYIISVTSNIVTLAILETFHVKKYDLVFDPSWSSKVKSDGANRKPVSPTYKCSLGVQPRIYHRFRDILSQRILTSTFDPLGSSKVKFDGANWKPMGTFLYDLCWVQHRISHRLATNHPRDHPTKDLATCVTISQYAIYYIFEKYDSLFRKNSTPTYRLATKLGVWTWLDQDTKIGLVLYGLNEVSWSFKAFNFLL